MVLNDGQYKIYKEAISWFKSKSSSQVFEIDGLAGTGKSVLIHEILKGLHLNHDQYMPMAYTGQASIVMRTKGFHTARQLPGHQKNTLRMCRRDTGKMRVKLRKAHRSGYSRLQSGVLCR